MADRFPSTPRAPRAVRIGAVVLGLLGVALATRTTLTSAAWVGRVFPGFLLLDNRVVASIGLAHWSGATVPNLYQHQVIAVDGEPVTTAAAVYAAAARQPPGTALRYRVEGPSGTHEIVLRSQRFTWRDWILVFGLYLLNASVYLASGLVVWVLRPQAALGRAMLMYGVTNSLWLLTAMDVYGPATLFRLHVVGETFFPAASTHLALHFPEPHRFARFWWLAYVLGLAVVAGYEAVLYQPALYTRALNTTMLWLGAVGVFFVSRLVREWWRSRSQIVQQRVRVMTLGTLLGMGIPGAIFLVSAVLGGGTSINAAAFSGFLFALSLAYAIVKHDLFEIDAMVKRGAYYLLLTGAVGAAYVGAVVVFNLLLQANAVTDSPAFPVAFTLAVLVVFNPLRTRLQGFVDRVFFNTRYDAGRVLAAIGAELAGALTRDSIVSLVRGAVQRAIPNTGTRLFIAGRDTGGPREANGTAGVAPVLVAQLGDGRVVTAFDSPESYPDTMTHAAVADALAVLGAEIAVPLARGGEVVGVLTAGPKRSGLFYTAGDAEFLRALAHQAAIALANAASYEALVALNAELEERVQERTAQLAQSEKMASLGRLVAGVAHEINNPVSFIAANIAPLRRRLQRVAERPEDAPRVLAEVTEIVDVMARGAERTAAIVRDLRSFSRLGEATRKAVDLHEGLEVSLRLLEPRWRDRITIERDYGTLPAVECDPGQINQVFMNVLANACDAIAGAGTIRVTTRAGADEVSVTIADDGPGMTPEVQARLFEPFFTTKDVGQGTGLGLAISHGVVAAHGGRIEVESAPGAGSRFRIVLPAVALDRAAGASG
ncbi:MAG: ATP-binding protein [Candidatus Binatia bacterium]